MANRVGKYKLSKKESELSLADGGTINGNVSIGNSTSTVGFFGQTKVALGSLIVSGALSSGGYNSASNYELTGSGGSELVQALSKIGIISSSWNSTF